LDIQKNYSLIACHYISGDRLCVVSNTTQEGLDERVSRPKRVLFKFASSSCLFNLFFNLFSFIFGDSLCEVQLVHSQRPVLASLSPKLLLLETKLFGLGHLDFF